jgi:cephalosporin-C deacetylase
MPIIHPHPFDPTYGYSLDDLFQVPAPAAPHDFAEFWKQTYAQAMQIPLNLECRKISSPEPEFELLEVEYDSWDRVRIGGWVVVPKDGEIECGAVVGHGYGGRETAGFDEPFNHAAIIFPCARGFHRSAHAEIPNNAQEHVLYGLESRETYSHRGSVVDYWLAASVLLELYPQIAKRLYFKGGSFGGGIGALLLPWDQRFIKAHLGVPSFGNYPLRVTLECSASGKAVKDFYDAGHPEILDVLKYFDAATAAALIQIPVSVDAATFDPGVPPPSQYSVYNAIPTQKELFIRQAAHFDLAGNHHDDAAIHARLRRWFAA